MFFDVAGALVKLYQVIRQDRELQAWIKLILSTFYAGLLGLLGGWGGALLAGKAAWWAFGAGLMSSATGVFTVLLRSPQARSLWIVAPQSVVSKYQEGQGPEVNPPTEK